MISFDNRPVDALRMSEGISKNDLAAFFGTKSSVSGQNGTKKVLSEQNNKDLREYYSKTNQSLVMKVYRLEVELANTRKLNEELRSENAMLMSRLHNDDADVSTARKIEAMVEERIRRRMDRLRYIGRRSIDSLQKATSTLKDVFGELGVELGTDGGCLIDEGNKSNRSSLVVSGEPCLPSAGPSSYPDENVEVMATPLVVKKRLIKDTPAVPWAETDTFLLVVKSLVLFDGCFALYLSSKLLSSVVQRHRFMSLRLLWPVGPRMGNCFSLKYKKKDFGREHPAVSNWLASCDFSSVPDGEEFVVEDPSPNCVIYDSEADADGYITALENLESEEDDASRDVVGGGAASSSSDDQQTNNMYVMPDDESVYETTDEQGSCDDAALPKTPVGHQKSQLTGNEVGDCECEEDDVVEELGEWSANYDARPICPLPTPLRKNLISPSVNLESLVDRKGRVRRSERVQLYLDEKRQLAQRL
ncbi:unnamed protein product [Nippostrongylus brasiliensis]|uniref:BZIP domain-containing protein n=1 Tax=Nippostrongylus brasiliensis TaxID=27835 RepID=A0A158R3B3_NIPBR|nr:unnamed protein product [Nippostrongylus brasiliensis]